MSAQFQQREFRDTATPAASEASLGTLLRQLMHEVPSLLGKEVQLAKGEMRENLDATRKAAGAVALGGAVATSGFIVLLFGLVYALATVVELWLAALMVGGIALVVGYGMIEAGRKKVQAGSLVPDRTLDSLRQDKDALKRRQP